MRGYPTAYGSGYSKDYNASAAAGVTRTASEAQILGGMRSGAPSVVTELVFIDRVNPSNVYSLTLEDGSFVFRDQRSGLVLGTPIWAQRPHFTLGVSVGGGGASSVLTSTGINRSSGADVSFNVQNSGSGAMHLLQDGVQVLT